ncbi:MAG: DUF4202 domain-containing protein [Verrucomicrobia bacterium]|jgi:hypothetical protein|nr:DUF4202 domain-containing protein [Verrucomicrobiota bacterium]
MEQTFRPDNAARFRAALEKFDETNAQDPHLELVGGERRPRELVHAERLTEWVLRLNPNASEALRLAARCQHLRRWEIPRQSYAMTREGYLEWREALKRMHADLSGAILRNLSYPEPTIDRVQSLNLKRNLKQDPECQTLEDALCLVFLEHQLPELAAKTPDDKVITALKKSWAKMSPQGREAALALRYGEREQNLLRAALA